MTTTKRILAVLALCLLTAAAYGQRGKAAQPVFDTAAFQTKYDIARWMAKYDMVARNTADHLLRYAGADVALLGPEWFCFEDTAGVWHAVYGSYKPENNLYDLVFHYTVDRYATMQATDAVVDSAILNPHARALKTAYKRLEETTDSLPTRLAPFILRNADRTFSVWLLPTRQDYAAVYGGEYAYVVDSTGNRILRDDSFMSKGGFREVNIEKPTMVWLDYSGASAPTQGAVFFAWYFRTYFPRVIIDTDGSVSVLVKSDDGWEWGHNAKQAPPKAGKGKK